MEFPDPTQIPPASGKALLPSNVWLGRVGARLTCGRPREASATIRDAELEPRRAFEIGGLRRRQRGLHSGDRPLVHGAAPEPRPVPGRAESPSVLCLSLGLPSSHSLFTCLSVSLSLFLSASLPLCLSVSLSLCLSFPAQSLPPLPLPLPIPPLLAPLPVRPFGLQCWEPRPLRKPEARPQAEIMRAIARAVSALARARSAPQGAGCAAQRAPRWFAVHCWTTLRSRRLFRAILPRITIYVSLYK